MFAYVLNGIRHYRRIHFVVMLAVAIATTVIGGSLIVGDSVRYSLQQMTLQRLGRITHVLHAPRFFTQQMTSEVAAEWNNLFTASRPPDADAIPPLKFAPAVLVNGSVERTETDRVRRAGTVTLLAVEETGWSFLEHDDVPVPVDREVVLGYRTATELQVQAGDDVSVWVEVPSSIPRDSLLGERDEVTLELVLTVSAVLPETAGASRFDLNPGQQLPYNAFLPLATLQERLDLDEIVPSRRDPIARPARINTILVASDGATDSGDSLANQLATTDQLNQILPAVLQPEDLELNLRTADRGYISAESDRMIIESAVADAVMEAAERLGLATSPAIVYLSNEIYAADRSDPDAQYSMYSIIAGVPFTDRAPLGPWRLANGDPVPELSSDEILLSTWLAEDLQVTAGDSIVATWHQVGSHGELPEIEQTFRVAGVLPAEDEVSIDASLTPYVKGITDVESFSDVDQPFEMKMDRLTARDDDYWDARRATPKAFVSLETASELWKNRYGQFTSIRIAASDGQTFEPKQAEEVADRLAFEITRALDVRSVGLGFRPVLLEGLQAAVGANDFTVLFIGFSFFLILSAIVLAALMFRLGMQQRLNQFGLLNATGWPASRVRNFFVAEAAIVCAAGAFLGAAGAIGFAQLMIYGLTTWWSGAVGTQFLQLDVQPIKLLVAVLASLITSVIVIMLALRSFGGIEIREQLSGNADAVERSVKGGRGWWIRSRRFVMQGCLVGAVVLPIAALLKLIPAGEAFGGLSWPMVCFFLAGFCSLTFGLLLLGSRLRRRSETEAVNGVTLNLGGLALANAARSPMRSMLTTALIAFATFVIVAVAAGRRDPLSEVPDINSGNGGFRLIAETAQPVLFDLTTEDGRSRLGLDGEQNLPSDVDLFAFSVKPGADASCVNLYQTTVPTILGASDRFIDRGGFRFADTPAEEWKLLKESLPDVTVTTTDDQILQVPAFPVIGDMNTLKYSLKKGIGDVIYVPNEREAKAALQVVGMLDGSLFQGVVVTTDEALKQIDGNVVGARYFLIATDDAAAADETAGLLESRLNDYGLDTEPVSERLAGFLAVQNTYLSTFQMLGGLGLLVGTFGLAAVMVRNVVERRRELALMRAVGFTSFRITRLILRENLVLLFWGILLGTISALLAMTPHLRSTGGDLQWRSLAMTLAAVAVAGSLASVFAVRAARSVSIRQNLASE